MCGAVGSGQPATASGVAIIYVRSVLRVFRRHPVGEIPGYARLPPPTGVAEMLALGHRLRLGRRCGALLCSAEGADASLRLVGGACGCCELGVAHVGATLQRGWRGLNECQNRLSQVPYILLV